MREGLRWMEGFLNREKLREVKQSCGVSAVA